MKPPCVGGCSTISSPGIAASFSSASVGCRFSSEVVAASGSVYFSPFEAEGGGSRAAGGTEAARLAAFFRDFSVKPPLVTLMGPDTGQAKAV